MDEYAGGDGGYNNSSPSAPSGASSGGKGGKATKRFTLSCASVTFKQLIHANIGPNDQYQIDMKDISSVRLVARIISVDQSESDKVTMLLTDGTYTPQNVSLYRYDTHLFLERLAEISTGFPLVELIVHIKPMSGGNMDLQTAGPENVRVIKEGNALTHHILDCINMHLFNTRPVLPRTGSTAGYSSSSAQAMYAAQLSMEGGSSGSGSGTSNPINDAVFDAFFKHVNDTGDDGRATDVYNLLQANPATKHITIPNIELACEQLMYEGRIYSTVDDVTFRTTS